MGARYILRFDDICPTMNWTVWDEIERIITKCNVAPIVAVVPDNQDQNLMVGPACSDFWDHVRSWQDRGWTIAMHGYQHRYTTNDAGLIGLNYYSEFAGVCMTSQREMLGAAKRIFDREKVWPTMWVAPAHSFDEATMEVIRGLGLTVISDGFALYPYTDGHGTLWLPQQLWKFRPLPFGVWTICMHHNAWDSKELGLFEENVSRYKENLTTYEAIRHRYGHRRRGLTDALFQTAFHVMIKLDRLISSR